MLVAHGTSVKQSLVTPGVLVAQVTVDRQLDTTAVVGAGVAHGTSVKQSAVTPAVLVAQVTIDVHSALLAFTTLVTGPFEEKTLVTGPLDAMTDVTAPLDPTTLVITDPLEAMMLVTPPPDPMTLVTAPLEPTMLVTADVAHGTVVKQSIVQPLVEDSAGHVTVLKQSLTVVGELDDTTDVMVVGVAVVVGTDRGDEDTLPGTVTKEDETEPETVTIDVEGEPPTDVTIVMGDPDAADALPKDDDGLAVVVYMDEVPVTSTKEAGEAAASTTPETTRLTRLRSCMLAGRSIAAQTVG